MELKMTLTAMQERLAKTRIVCLEETSVWLLTDKDKRGKLMDAMWDCIQTLENHSKRNNVRLIGLKETNGKLLSCVLKILMEGLGVCAEAELEIETVHRLLAPIPTPTDLGDQCLYAF